jgi:hypothetical protein
MAMAMCVAGATATAMRVDQVLKARQNFEHVRDSAAATFGPLTEALRKEADRTSKYHDHLALSLLEMKSAAFADAFSSENHAYLSSHKEAHGSHLEKMNNLIDAIDSHKQATEALIQHAHHEIGLDEHSHLELLEVTKHQSTITFQGLKKKFSSLGKKFIALVVSAAKKLWHLAKTLAKIIYTASDYLYLGLGAEGALLPPSVHPVVQICFAAEDYLLHSGKGFADFAINGKEGAMSASSSGAHFLEMAERSEPIADNDVAKTASEIDEGAVKPADVPDNTEKGVKVKDDSIFGKILTAAGNKVTAIKDGAKKIFKDLGEYSNKCQKSSGGIEAKICMNMAVTSHGPHIIMAASLNMPFIECIMKDLNAAHAAQEPVVTEENKAAVDKEFDDMPPEAKKVMNWLGFKGASDVINMIGDDPVNGAGRAFFGVLAWVGNKASILMGVKKAEGGEHAAALIELQEHSKKIRGLAKRGHGHHTCYHTMMAGVSIFPPVLGSVGIEYNMGVCAKEGKGVVPMVKMIGKTIIDFWNKKVGGKEEEAGSKEEKEHEELELTKKKVHESEAGVLDAASKNEACSKLKGFHVIEALPMHIGLMTAAHFGPMKPAIQCVSAAAKDMVKGIFARQGLCRKAGKVAGCKKVDEECLKDNDCDDSTSCEGNAAWRNLKGKCVAKSAIQAGGACSHDFECVSTRCSRCRVNCKAGAFGAKKGVCRMKKKNPQSRKGVVGSRCQAKKDCKCPGCVCQGEVAWVSDGACQVPSTE